jgi:signal transduction histidine kinase
MLKKIYGTIAAGVFLFFNVCLAQREQVDSLKKFLPSLRDSAKVDCLNALSGIYIKFIRDTLGYCESPLCETTTFPAFSSLASQYANWAHEEAVKIIYSHGIAESLSYMAEIAELSDNFPLCEKFSREAIYWYGKTLDKKRIAETFFNLGHSLYAQSFFAESLRNLDTAQQWHKKNGNINGIYWTLTVAGAVLHESGNYEKAFELARKCLDIATQTNSDWFRRGALTDIAWVYEEIDDHKTALEYYRLAGINPKQDALDSAQFFTVQHRYDSAKYYYSLVDTSSQRTLRVYLTRMGEFYFKQKQYDKALPNFTRALYYHRQLNDRNPVMRTLLDIAKTYLALGNDNSALKYGKECLSTAKKTGAKQVIRDASGILSSVYDNLHQPDSAFFYYKLHTVMKDSVLNNQVKGKLAAYTFEQKMELVNKEKQIQAARLQEESLLKNILIGSIIVLLVLAAIIFRIIVLKRRNEKQRLEHEHELKQLETKLESQQALLNERLRISRELHDDIGSTLGSISIYSEVAKKSTEKNENTKEVLSKIGRASRELIDKMSDIVWSLNPNNEGFGQLQNRMRAFAAMILAPRDIRYDFIADGEFKKLQLTGMQRKNIFLIFKEALYNIVKYADCETATITLCEQNNNLVMIIQDDGKGFNTGQTTTDETFSRGEYLGGNGLKNMHARAHDMNGKLCIESETGHGTTVQLTLLL